MGNSSRNIFWGGLIAFIGFIFLLENFGLFDVGWFFGNFWPLVLIVAGIAIIMRQKRSRSSVSYNKQGTQTITDAYRKTIIFGDVEFDLTSQQYAKGEHEIIASTIIGDIKLRIPDSIPATVSLSSMIGDLAYKSKRVDGFLPSIKHIDSNFHDSDARFVIKCDTCLGDIKVVSS